MAQSLFRFRENRAILSVSGMCVVLENLPLFAIRENLFSSGCDAASLRNAKARKRPPTC